MTRKMFLLFNHQLSSAQKIQAEKQFCIQQFFEMPPQLKRLWQQVPADTDTLSDYIAPFKTWLSDNTNQGDVVLVQGDFGVTYAMVQFAFGQNLQPVYATSVRTASEKIQADGSIKLVHIFNFCRFRQYGV